MAQQMTNSGRGPKWARRSLKRHMVMVGSLSLLLVVGIGGWASTTELSSAVIAQGIVVVDDNVKKIQHLTGGIVSQVLVREGDEVKAGQELFRLDGTPVKAELGIVESSLSRLYARRARLQAEILGEGAFDLDAETMKLPEAEKFVKSEQEQLVNRKSALVGMRNQLQSRQQQLEDEVDGVDVQLKATADSLDLIVKELVGLEKLYSKGLTSMQRLSELKRQQAQLEGRRGELLAGKAQARGRQSEISLQILQLDEDRRAEISKEQTETESAIAEAEQRRRAATDQLHRLSIISPVEGKALQVAVHTVNGVINPGETLMLVVPDSKKLTVEARILSNDIDQIRVGQTVRVRFTAFNQRTTPEVNGQVVTIAGDIVIDEQTRTGYYPIRIHPDETSVAHLAGLSLHPGMVAEVFMKIGDRSVLSYLMKPMMDQMQHAFRED